MAILSAAERKRLKQAGDGGDTDVVHVNLREERILERAGGSGTINPKTGLREFEGGGEKGGKNQGSKQGGGHDDTKSGNTGGGGSSSKGPGGGFTHGGLAPSQGPGPSKIGGGGGANTGVGGDRPLRGLPTTPYGGGPPSQVAETPYGAPVHYDYGKYGLNTDGTPTKTAQSPEKWKGTKQRVEDYNKAVKEYENRDFFGKVMDFLAGPLYDEQAPNIDDPRTYWGGKYHTSTDPVAAAAMAAGTFGGVPFAGEIVGQAEDLAGIDADVYHHTMPAGQREKYGMSPEGGWGKEAGGTNTGASPGRSPTDRTSQMDGGLLAHPSQIVTGQGGLQSQPSNPSVPTTPPTPPANSLYPTPTELWGAPGQSGQFIFDDATGQVKFVPA